MMNQERLTAEEATGIILESGRNAVYRLAQQAEALASYRIRTSFSSPSTTSTAILRKSATAQAPPVIRPVVTSAKLPRPGRASWRRRREMRDDGGFVLAGNDMAGDIIANHLNASGVKTKRVYRGSYYALIDLYTGNADAALTHLVPTGAPTRTTLRSFSVLPSGAPVTIIRLYQRRMGFVVREGNPLRITTWGGLLNKGVRLANRQRGCGTRILLNEKLVSLEANPRSIEGYDDELPSALAVVNAAAKGSCNIGLATEHASKQADGVEFVPLQNEWLDIAVAKTERTLPLVRATKALTTSHGFKEDLVRMTADNCDALGDRLRKLARHQVDPIFRDANPKPVPLLGKRAAALLAHAPEQVLVQALHLVFGMPHRLGTSRSSRSTKPSRSVRSSVSCSRHRHQTTQQFSPGPSARSCNARVRPGTSRRAGPPCRPTPRFRSPYAMVVDVGHRSGVLSIRTA